MGISVHPLPTGNNSYVIQASMLLAGILPFGIIASLLRNTVWYTNGPMRQVLPLLSYTLSCRACLLHARTMRSASWL